MEDGANGGADIGCSLYCSVNLPFGQRLALERFVRDKKAVAAVVEHGVADPSEDVRLADCQVRDVFVGGEFVWRATRRQMTAWELTDAYTRYAGRRCA